MDSSSSINCGYSSMSSSNTSVSNKPAEYVSDKGLRLRSYFRRRPVPFKRAVDLDMQVGSATFLVSLCEEVEECTYVGDEELVHQFLDPKGLQLSHALEISKRSLRVPSFSTESHEEDEEEDEYFSTVEERRKKERAKKREAAQRVSDGEFLRNPIERSKVFSSRKESLMTKVIEMDTICGSKSFILIVCPEKEAAYYQGSEELVSQFFISGLSSSMIHRDINIRPFEPDETECNICSVPHCNVSRNTLSKWRLAAMDLFGFPDNIPMTMYACPEADRDQWIAELDLDPSIQGKITVCSLHFREGFPTDDFPYPTELLSETNYETTFQGTKTSSWRQGVDYKKSNEDFISDILDDILINVDKKAKENEDIRSQHLAFTRLTNSRSWKKKFSYKRLSLWKPSRITKDLSSLRNQPYYKKLIRYYCKRKRYGYCRFCKMRLNDSKEIFEHIRIQHFGLTSRLNNSCDIDAKSSSLPIDVELSDIETKMYLNKLYPKQDVPTKNPKKKYVCGVCQSQFDLHGIFVHMKQVHKGMLCQYCLKLFMEVNELEAHLKRDHKVHSRYYHSFDKFEEISGSRYNFVCGQCNKMVRFSDLKNSAHKCTSSSSTVCSNCDRTFTGSYQLELHLVNGWCKMDSTKEISFIEASKLYKVLTGKKLSHSDVLKHKGLSAILPLSETKKAQVSSTKEFSVADRQILMKYHSVRNNKKVSNFKSSRIITSLPLNGNIYCGAKSRGISNNLRKEIKEEGYKYEDIKDCNITRLGKSLIVNFESPVKIVPPLKLHFNQAMKPLSNVRRTISQSKANDSQATRHSSTEDKENLDTARLEETADSSNSFNGLEDEDQQIIAETTSKEHKLQRLQREYEEIIEDLSNMRNVIQHFSNKCLVCQQAHLVCVDSTYLLSHLFIVHDNPTVVSILKEDPQKSINRMKRYLKDTKSKEIIFSYQQDKDLIIDFYSCSYCSTKSCSTNEDLFRHLEKEHSQKVLTCNLCQSIFLNYGSFISHVCYGPPTNSQKQKAAKFNCKVCLRQDLSSFLIFQNHVRRDHNICEICFKCQGSQESLYSHCLQHSQELMCMKCFLAYDEYDQFRKHLYFKHYDECRICGICYQKTWPHVYHFCIQDLPSSCEVCDKKFKSTKQYRVHMRTHTNIHPYVCSASNCSKAFISKQLLWKHQIRRHPDLSISATKALEDKRNSKEVLKYKASSIHVIRDIQVIIEDIINDTIVERKVEDAPVLEDNPTDPEPEKEIDPLQAAVASIMGDDGIFNTKTSPVKPLNIQSPATPTKTNIQNNNNSIVQASAGLINSNVPAAPSIPKIQEPPKIMHPSEYFNKKPRAYSDTDSDEEDNKFKKKKSVFPISGASSAPVVGGIWNQDLLFVSNGPNTGKAKVRKPGMNKTGSGLKVMKPITEGVSGGILSKISTPQTPVAPKTTFTSLDPNSITKKLGTGGWEVCLSESSGDSDAGGPDKPKKVKMIDKIIDRRIPVMDHDYCYESYMLSLEPPKPPELSEMDKILSNVALGVMDNLSPERSPGSKKKQKHKKNKKESKKKKKKSEKSKTNDSSSDSEDENRKSNKLSTSSSTLTTPFIRKAGPKPKYHTPLSGAGGVTAGTGRIMFNSSSDEDEDIEDTLKNGDKRRSNDEATSASDICSSDLDTDFSADEFQQTKEEEEEEEEPEVEKPIVTFAPKPLEKVAPPVPAPKPTLKLKIKLPSVNNTPTIPVVRSSSHASSTKLVISKNRKRTGAGTFVSSTKSPSRLSSQNRSLSKKMRESLALNRDSSSSSYTDEDDYSAPPPPPPRAPPPPPPQQQTKINNKSTPKAYVISDAHGTSGLMYNSDPERLYCVCQCPHDEVSEMIGCDAPDCQKEWFHFECVGILVPPAGKWYCPECSSRYKIRS
nr:LOW QUALITY PROTEIN: uncharacterized protein LOC121121511 [Lepeophtheirus salmonis]